MHGGLKDRLLRHNIPHAGAVENLARGPSVAQIVYEQMAMMLDRANLLDDRWNWIGVALRRHEGVLWCVQSLARQ